MAATTAREEMTPPEPPRSGNGAADVKVRPIIRGQETYPAVASWRQYVLARAGELAVYAEYTRARALTLAQTDGAMDPATVEALARAAYEHIEEARLAAKGASRRRRGPTDWMSGASIERAMGNLNSAEVQIARYAPLDELEGWLPDIVSSVHRYLKPSDPRRCAVDAIANRAEPACPLGEQDRRVLAWAMHGVNSSSEQQHIRVRSFRNIVLFTAATLLAVAIGIAAVGIAQPHLLPICFQPADSVVCATAAQPFEEGDDLLAAYRSLASSWDIVLIEAVGLVAAALAGAFSLHQIKGTSTPFSVPVALAVLKLPCGALTALLGMLLMRGEFVPGLSALDSSAQVIAWAIVFGYAQQVFTHLVDRQAHKVLDGVGTPEPAPDPPPRQ
jgi:hypothetical protein